QQRRAEAANARVAGLSGGVVAPCHPFLPIRNGKTTLQWHTWSYSDARSGGLSGFRLEDYLRRGGAEWVVLDGVESDYERETVRRLYDPAGPWPDAVSTLIPPAWPKGPRELYRRKPQGRPPTRSSPPP